MLSKIGPYQVTRQIGKGGMATVYQAHQAKLDRHVAVKVMHEFFVQDQDFLTRFEREARIVASLDHPNIVPIYDYDEFDHKPYLVMKHIDGMTLKDLLRKTTLRTESILQLLTPIADALTYAHAQGVLHRDVKPSNILIDQEGHPYLTDFGLARMVAQGESTMSADTMLGTPHYISPEQAKGLTNLTSRTDVYSFGIVLYELVTGRVPFMADSSFAIVHEHIYSPPPSPSEINPKITPEVEDVLLKALEKNPDDRYATPNALIGDYQRALHGARVEARPVRQQTKAQRDAPPPNRIPAPMNTHDEDDKDEGVFSEVKHDLREAGEEVRAAFREIRQAFGANNNRKMPRPGAKWMNDGPEGSGFYTEDDLRQYENENLDADTRIRRRVERKLKARRELREHVTIYITVNLLLWVIWAATGASAFPWPLIVMGSWGIGIAGNFIEYYNRYGRGYERERETLEREVERERRRFYGEDSKAKRKIKNDDEAAGSIRLTEDGELSESFINEITGEGQQERGGSV